MIGTVNGDLQMNNIKQFILKSNGNVHIKFLCKAQELFSRIYVHLGILKCSTTFQIPSYNTAYWVQENS